MVKLFRCLSVPPGKRFLTRIFTAVILADIILAATPASAITRVYLLGGQSNMAGLGGWDKPIYAPYNTPQTDVKFWSDRTASQWVNLQSGYGNYGSTNFGPEVSFGYAVNNKYPDDDIYLIKYGVSGTTLAVDWNPNGTGAKYNTFKTIVNAALSNLSKAGITYTIEGMLWMQGESDAQNSTYAANYKKNLTNLISVVRSNFSAPDMEFVIGRITTYYGTTANNTLVRSAQDAVADEVSNVSCFGTDDLSWAYGGHYGTDGQIELGIRFAEAVPEPGTLIMLAGALLGLSPCVRRKWKCTTS
jgi:hypothetical protein